MDRKHTLRVIIDTAMAFSIPLLMLAQAFDLSFHIMLGLIFLILLASHLLINHKWFNSIFKGKRSAFRIYRITLNIALLIFSLLIFLSALLMLTFMPEIRSIHTAMSYWMLALSGMHFGAHIRAKGKSIKFALALISLYGLFAFILNEMWRPMFMISEYVFIDFSYPVAILYLNFLSVFVLFGAISLILKRFLLSKL